MNKRLRHWVRVLFIGRILAIYNVVSCLYSAAHKNDAAMVISFFGAAILLWTQANIAGHIELIKEVLTLEKEVENARWRL